MMFINHKQTAFHGNDAVGDWFPFKIFTSQETKNLVLLAVNTLGENQKYQLINFDNI